MKYLLRQLWILFHIVTISNLSFSQTNTVSDSLKAKKSKDSSASTFLQNVKVTGFIQPQFQYVETKGASTVSAGNFADNTNSRIVLRRGRLKTTFTSENSVYVFQIDATELGVTLDEVYVTVTEPWLNTFSITAGIFNRPLGYEVAYSSSKLEPAERSRVVKAICPGEKDMGAMITITPPTYTPLHDFVFEIGLFNGTGPYTRDFDNRKDLIAHLYYTNTVLSDLISYRLGASLQSGGFDNQRNNHYSWDDGFVLTPNDTLAKAVRNFKALEGEFTVKWKMGTTQMRGEYFFGQQSATLSSNRNPAIAPDAEAATRYFTGGYLLLLNTIPQTKLELVARYDWYDPNSRASGEEIGTLSDTGKSDICYKTFGFGFNYLFNVNLKLLAWYELITNESTMVSGYTSDLNDNLFTLRLQYKF
jgi:hypothetical protein